MTAEPTLSEMTTSETIYRHKKRGEQWGLAILAFEDGDRRAFQFQDGELRNFKKGYYHLLEPVTPAPSDAPKIVQNLKVMMKKADIIRESAGSPSLMPAAAIADLSVIRKVFLETYAGGLASEDYAAEIRGNPEKRRLKKHRDAAILDAKEKLSLESIEATRADGGAAAVRDLLLGVLSATDLVTKKSLEPLESLPDALLPALDEHLCGILHGSGPYEARFERFVGVLDRSGTKASWELATAAASLYDPDAHVHVKAGSFRELVDRFSPALRWSARPSGRIYTRLVSLVEDIAASLRAAGDPPRDLHDVSYMVWSVMRPKSRPMLDRECGRGLN